MISLIANRIRSSRVGLFIRSRITKWPGYQQVPQRRLTHKITMKMRVLLSFLSVSARLEKSFRERISVTRHLRGTKSGEVLLIGNGPSAGSLTLAQVERFRRQGGKIAVMNSYYRSALSTVVSPDYYFVVDPEFWKSSHEENANFKEEFAQYIENFAAECTIIQGAGQTPILSTEHKYIFLDGRSVAGLVRIARPDRPWGLPASVTMLAIATLRFLGHPRIYFTGLDSNMHNHFFINHSNEILFDTNGYYSYSKNQRDDNRQDAGSRGVQQVINDPIRHMADLLYANGIFLRDLYWLCSNDCVNVGNDQTNDAAPRACLLF